MNQELDVDPSRGQKRCRIVMTRQGLAFSFNHGAVGALTPIELACSGLPRWEERVALSIYRQHSLFDSGIVVIDIDRVWLRLEEFKILFQGHRSLKRPNIPGQNFREHDELHIGVDVDFYPRLGASRLEGRPHVLHADRACLPI